MDTDAVDMSSEVDSEVSAGEKPQFEQMESNAGQAARFLKTLANERRLMILCHLVCGERSVGELEQLLGMRQPALSQQLARLREDELVATRRESRTIYYRIASPEAETLLEQIYMLFCGKR